MRMTELSASKEDRMRCDAMMRGVVMAPPWRHPDAANLDSTAPRWTPQEPTKVATVSQFAAPLGRRGIVLIWVAPRYAGPPLERAIVASPGKARSHSDLNSAALPWTPQEPTRVATFSQIAFHRGGKVSF